MPELGWVQDPLLPLLAPEAPEQCGRIVGGRPGLLGHDVLRQLPATGWDVVTVHLPDRDVIAQRLAEVGSG